MAASFSLIIEDDAGKQIVVPFAKDVITIGRKEGNTIRLTERNVSRFHARLSKEASHVVVEDLTSFNGVKLNGDRIAGRVEVGAGDVIEIGDYHLELRTAQTSATTQKMGPAGAKSAAIDHNHADDDEFEGDTQRWDQPVGNAFPVAVGAMPTVEERIPTIGQGNFNNDGDTEKLDLDKLSSMVGAGQAAPPPAPLAPAQSWPPPPRTASPPAMSPADLEATVRQPVASAPLIPPPAPPPPPALSAPTALTAPLTAAPSGDDELDATQDMPLPAVVQARANLQAQGVGVRRDPSPVEQTEQLRISPAIAAIAEDLALPRLVVLNTIFSGSTFPLRAMENVLGRTDDNDIVLEHRSVSRNHAKLVREGERVRILDLKSANGVLVNGEEVEQHVLKSGDVIELGRVRIRFVPVGERFVVPADEIERARIADANGDGGDDVPLVTANVGTPMRGDLDGTAKKPVVLYAILAVLVIMVVALGAIVLTRDDPQPAGTGTGTVGAAEVVDEAVVVAAAEPATPEPAVNEQPADTAAAAAATTEPPRKDSKPDRAVEKEREKDREKEREKDKEKPKETVAAAPASNDVQLDEARRAIFSSNPAEAQRGVKLVEDLVKRNPREPRFQLVLATAYKQTGQLSKVKATYEHFLQQWPTGSDAEKVKAILAAL